MSGSAGFPLAPPLAFQVWDAIGWAGQGLFALRVLLQWYESEKAKRSHVRASFWWISLAATALLLVYMMHRRDPVFVVGFCVNGFVYARNLRLMHAPDRATRGGAWLTLVLGLALAGLFVFVWLAQAEVFREDDPGAWLAVGVIGQTLWTSRFLLQWVASERRGESLLPASFFWVSIAGAALLFAYAVARLDWVMMAAFAFNPIPYVRNLVLLRRPAEEQT